MSQSRTRTRNAVLVDPVRESPVDRYLLRRRRITLAVIVVVVVIAVLALTLGG